MDWQCVSNVIHFQGCTKNTWQALWKIASHITWWRGSLWALKRLATWPLNPPVFFSQVSFMASMHQQSFSVEVSVIDKNDNVPMFLQESMRGTVQLGLLKGGRIQQGYIMSLSSFLYKEFILSRSHLHI